MHQTNLLLLEKRFYAESEEIVALDILMHNAILDFKSTLNSFEAKKEMVFQYEDGTVAVFHSSNSISEILEVTVKCTTVKNRKYEIQFEYNQATNQIMNWKEMR
nr:competence type IV pilus minor pilin ComGG [Bacillus sp. 165]